MAIRTVKIEFPFEKFLSVIEQLTDREKAILKGKLEKDWRNRFTVTLAQLRKKTAKFPPEEVEKNVKEAVREVRKLGA